MQAMILAAGRGLRMRPLTDTIPKPLLTINNQALIVYHIKKLAEIGIKEIVINYAWLGEKIIAALGDGSSFGVKIQYSPEPKGGLETAGGIIKALDILKSNPFLVINADIWTDINFIQLKLPANSLAHLILVPNPKHNCAGDFGFLDDNSLSFDAENKLTYSGVGIFSKELFEGYPKSRLALRTIFEHFMPLKKITGHVHNGIWSDVGTITRLQELQA